MTYLKQLQQQELQRAFDELRPDFRDRIFTGGIQQAKALTDALGTLLFPGTDCLCEHYRTCFDFYITYAFARLMGYDAGRAENSCQCKYGALPPMVFAAALSVCEEQFYQSFPTMKP